jgi:hypothetical protein
MPAGSAFDGVGVAVGVAVGEAGVGALVGDADEPHWISTLRAAAQSSATSTWRNFISTSERMNLDRHFKFMALNFDL